MDIAEKFVPQCSIPCCICTKSITTVSSPGLWELLPSTKCKSGSLQFCRYCQQCIVFIQGIIVGQSLCVLLGHLSFSSDCDCTLSLDTSEQLSSGRDFTHSSIADDSAGEFHLDNCSDFPVSLSYQDDNVDSKKVQSKGNISADMVAARDGDDMQHLLRSTASHRKCKSKNAHSKKMKVKTKNKTEHPDVTSLISTEILETAPESRVVNGVSESTSAKTRRHCKRREQLKCRECNKVCSTEQRLYLHYVEKHKEKVTDTDRMRVYPCSDCGKVFGKKTRLTVHRRKCHRDTLKWLCSICEKPFTSRAGVSLHMRMTHNTDSPKNCELCEESFTTYKELYNHKSKSHNIQNCVCHICGKHFKFKSALQPHLDAHAGTIRHFCDVCGRGFVRVTTLSAHRAVAHPDAGDKPFQCKLCLESFPAGWVLKKHVCRPLLEAHKKGLSAKKEEINNCEMCQEAKMTAVKCPLHTVYQCLRCGKQFLSPVYLKVHMKQHQEANFACDICGKKFTYKCNMQNHRTTHFCEKPYQCEVCHKAFRLQSALKTHSRKHREDLQFKCHICGKGLIRRQNLKNHIEKMHRGSQ
ncbi:hypothetical protein BaRGS_00004045 [Batillaria attramentaria]|uniref:C2H2-type domain-containing protein n=1 Tax=Batillaria attramentaria TaxID=370345 RepID=A0ABD0LY02_9CAEN